MKQVPKQCVSCPNLMSTSAEPFCCRYMEAAAVSVGTCTITGHVSVAANTEKLVKMIELSETNQEGIVRHLEDMVRATKAREALSINKEGITAQITYLFTSRTPMAIAKAAVMKIVEKVKGEDEQSLLPTTTNLMRVLPPKPVVEEPKVVVETQRRYRR